jgi:hypothetical protein
VQAVGVSQYGPAPRFLAEITEHRKHTTIVRIPPTPHLQLLLRQHLPVRISAPSLRALPLVMGDVGQIFQPRLVVKR